MAGTRRVTLRQASEVLGVSIEAVRKRVKRGSLPSEKGSDGRVYVYLDESTDAGGDASHPEPPVEGTELVEELRDRVRFLEDQLQQANERDRENRRIVAALTSRIPELEAPSEAERPGEAESVGEEPESAEPRSDAPGAQEGVRRPWWRRVFGG
jgi:hypothetical protein